MVTVTVNHGPSPTCANPAAQPCKAEPHSTQLHPPLHKGSRCKWEGAWGRVKDRNWAEGRGSRQMKADREESGVKVPRSDSGSMKLSCKQHVATADSVHPRHHDCMTNTSVTHRAVAFAACRACSDNFFTALCQGCVGIIFFLWGLCPMLQLSKRPVLA